MLHARQQANRGQFSCPPCGVWPFRLAEPAPGVLPWSRAPFVDISVFPVTAMITFALHTPQTTTVQGRPKSVRDEARGLADAVVEAAVAGEPAAIGAVLRELAPEIARVVRAIFGPHDMSVEDTIQDSLLSLMHALPTFRGECNIRRYANRIAARTALLARRRTRTVRERETRFSLDERPPAYIAGRHDLTQRRKAFVHRMFDVLPEAQAEVLALRFLLGYSLDEIAQAVGAPVNTVRSRIRLAKQVMRVHLEHDPELLEHPPGRA
jgi:RNA polymerase sigma-70 factor (ECF subfamily)